MTSYISFCNKQTLNIIDDNFKEDVLNILSKKYYITIKDRSFYVIKKNNIKYMENNSYILSIKSLGALYYLFLTTINDINYCIYIDKKVKEGHNYPRMLIVNYRFDDSLYSDTLFEGELLKNNENEWCFIIINLHLFKGELQKNKTIVLRLSTVYKIFNDLYKKDNHLEICPLYIKRLFSYHELDTMIDEYIPNLNYKVRGIYFEGLKNAKRDKTNRLQNSNDHLYLFPRNMSFDKKKKVESLDNIILNKEKRNKQSMEKINIKYKCDNLDNLDNLDFSNKENITFMIRKTEKSDIYNLYCLDNDDIKKYGIAWINSLKISKKIAKGFRNKDSYNVSCKYSKEMEKWYPVEMTENKVDNFDSIIGYLEMN